MNAIRHGELVLLPINHVCMTGAKPEKNYIVSNSKSEHPHVLEGESMVLEHFGRDTIIQVNQDTCLIQRKESDCLNNMTVKKGIYRVLHKKEYDPFSQIYWEGSEQC